MLSNDLEKALNSAFKRARDKRHEFITVEHLLLALTENDSAVDVLLACGVKMDSRSEYAFNCNWARPWNRTPEVL